MTTQGQQAKLARRDGSTFWAPHKYWAVETIYAREMTFGELSAGVSA
jgi:hypothetical protein